MRRQPAHRILLFDPATEKHETARAATGFEGCISFAKFLKIARRLRR
jgi:hypothetical protein